MKLKGLIHDAFDTYNSPPDFEGWLGNEGASSHLDIHEMTQKVQRRLHAMGLLLAYWMPTRLETAATRYAIAWSGAPNLAEQYEKAFLHYLNFTEMAPQGRCTDPERARFDRLLDTFAQLLREMRERVEFIFHRASAIRGSAPTEHIANSLLRKESDVLAAVQDVVSSKLSGDPQQAVEAVEHLLRRFPELERSTHDERVALGQRISTWAGERHIPLLERLARIPWPPVQQGAADPLRVLREMFPVSAPSDGEPI